MKKVGIWLDKEKAHCFIMDSEKEHFITINSELEFYNPKGGSRSKTRWGPQDVVQDSKYLEREKHQLKRYFEKIAATVKPLDQLVIFGPAETPNKLHAMLRDSYPDIAKKIKKVDKVDSMTDNQFKALVRQQ